MVKIFMCMNFLNVKMVFAVLSLMSMSFAGAAYSLHSLMFGTGAALCVFAMSCVFAAKQEHKLAMHGNADLADIGEKQAMLFH